MSSKKNNNKEDIIISSTIEKTKKSNNILIISLLCTIIILFVLLCYYMFFKKCDKESICSSFAVKTVEVEVDPKHQFINYQGFKFRMSLDWDFVSTDNKYEISNKDENLFISLESINVSYDDFKSSAFQKTFLETLQTSGNINIEKEKTAEKDKKEYYLLEGTNNNYNYMITVIGNDEKVILVKTQFKDKVSYDKLKNSVIKFTVSALKIS
jgi:uncharacterized protein YpmB